MSELKSTGIRVSKEFAESLARKIKDIRYRYDIPPNAPLMKGKLFWDDETVLEMVVSSVTSGGLLTDEDMIGASLNFDPAFIKDGKYDKLIHACLTKLAQIDYKRETSLDFH
jgi:hypothetical protein